VVSISDAARAAPDFVILRTTQKSAAEFMACFQFHELDPQISPVSWAAGLPSLIVLENRPEETSRPTLSMYDAGHVRRLELMVDASSEYTCRAGLELPHPGLRLLRAWTAEGKEIQAKGNLVSAH
jgi:hypothetical protein